MTNTYKWTYFFLGITTYVHIVYSSEIINILEFYILLGMLLTLYLRKTNDFFREKTKI